MKQRSVQFSNKQRLIRAARIYMLIGLICSIPVIQFLTKNLLVILCVKIVAAATFSYGVGLVLVAAYQSDQGKPPD